MRRIAGERENNDAYRLKDEMRMERKHSHGSARQIARPDFACARSADCESEI